MFLDRIAATPTAEAFRYPENGGWTTVTWQQVGQRVELLAAGLISLGIKPEERVALASGTRYEWVVVDFAILAAGAATTTVYPTTHAEDVAFIVANSGSRIVVAEDQKQVDKLIAHRAELPAVQNVVVIDGDGDGDWVITLADLEQRGKQLLADSPSAADVTGSAVMPAGGSTSTNSTGSFQPRSRSTVIARSSVPPTLPVIMSDSAVAATSGSDATTGSRKTWPGPNEPRRSRTVNA